MLSPKTTPNEKGHGKTNSTEWNNYQFFFFKHMAF